MTASTEPRPSTAVRFGQWFVRTHFPVDMAFGIAAISLALIRWGSMPTWEQVGYAIYIVLCIHQVEEYRFPGGFVWGLNMTMRSRTPENYPGNALSAVFVDVSTLIVWGLLLFLAPFKGLVAFLILFALMEVLGHLSFGINAYRRYKGVGKTTVYFPGNLTAFLGFTPTAIWGIHTFVSGHLLTGGGWWLVVLANVLFAAIWMGIPTKLAQNEHSPFSYPAPAEGFYLHKYEERLCAREMPASDGRAPQTES